ncbi:MAG: hypothetical protein K2X81_20170, partial [Candidatus Obscuribacterales bacterium]|nr:hypothetical protein [Candidatus Obscuribacterales bacterium]
MKFLYNSKEKQQCERLKFKLRSSFVLATVFALFSALGSYAESAQNSNKDAVKPNFTKIQDLDVEKKALNRPVRQKWAVVVGVSKFRDARLNSQ